MLKCDDACCCQGRRTQTWSVNGVVTGSSPTQAPSQTPVGLTRSEWRKDTHCSQLFRNSNLWPRALFSLQVSWEGCCYKRQRSVWQPVWRRGCYNHNASRHNQRVSVCHFVFDCKYNEERSLSDLRRHTVRQCICFKSSIQQFNN